MGTTSRTLLALTVAVAVAASVVVPVAGAAAATPEVTWQVQPSTANGPQRAQIDASVEPAGSVADAITVSNLGDVSLNLSIEAFDMVKTPSGEVTIPAEPTDPPLAAGWVSYAADTVELDAGSQADVPFTVTPPANAEPGDYGIALVATMSRPTETENGQQVILDTRVGVRLYLRVLGDLRSELAIDQFTIDRDSPWWNPLPSIVSTDLTVANTGNVRLDATVTLTLEGPFGLPLGQTAPRPLPQLLPGDVIQLSRAQAQARGDESAPTGPAQFAATIASFFLQATAHVEAVEVSSGQPFTFTQTQTASDIPWALLTLLILLLLALGILIGRAVKRRRRRRGASVDDTHAAAP